MLYVCRERFAFFCTHTHRHTQTIEFNDAQPNMLGDCKIYIFCVALVRYSHNSFAVYTATDAVHVHLGKFTFVFAFLPNGLGHNSWLSDCKTIKRMRIGQRYGENICSHRRFISDFYWVWVYLISHVRIIACDD